MPSKRNDLEISRGLNTYDKKDKWRKWQTLQFFRDQNDNLYLLGGDKSTVPGGDIPDDDFIGLFKFNLANFKYGPGDAHLFVQLIEYITEKHIRLGEPDMGSLDAASTFYVSPTGQLILYTVTHKPKDTVDDVGDPVRSVVMGEFRSVLNSHTRTCGPQWLENDPNKHLGGPYNIKDGESLIIDGRVYFIEPWVHMFEDTLMDWSNIPLNPGGLSLMMDWRSQFDDDFNDLNKFKFINADFKDRADAFCFCGVQGSSLYLYTHPTYVWDHSHPFSYLTPFSMRAGTGNVIVEYDLGNYYGSNYHDDVESAYIHWIPPDPNEIAYTWELDNSAKGTISVKEGEEHLIEYKAGCGTYTDILDMKYYNKDEWRAKTQIHVSNAPPSIDLDLQAFGLEGSLDQ